MQTTTKPQRRFYCYPANEQVEGPFELVELAGLLRASHITGETPILVEGEEQWLLFQDRPEFHFAQEIPLETINRHVAEKADEQESSFSPRKLARMVWYMAPVFLYILYRFVRMYISYHLAHDADASGDTLDSAVSSGN